MTELSGFNPDDYRRNLFPAGEYAVTIVESELTDRKAGNGRDWKFKFRVLRGSQQNKDCTFWLAYDIPGATGGMAQAQEIGRGTIADICRATGIVVPKNTNELVGKNLMITVKHTEGKAGGTYANISKVEPTTPVTAAASTTTAATTAAVDPSGEMPLPAGW